MIDGLYIQEKFKDDPNKVKSHLEQIIVLSLLKRNVKPTPQLSEKIMSLPNFKKTEQKLILLWILFLNYI